MPWAATRAGLLLGVGWGGGVISHHEILHLFVKMPFKKKTLISQCKDLQLFRFLDHVLIVKIYRWGAPILSSTGVVASGWKRATGEQVECEAHFQFF